ncbi:MAG TPA: hypothetical protein VIM98_14960 [Dyella sp.]|uniref:hypothetical protein n=1 Tax=Dyella sp. TaxID=1869338 RepID=UPI002F93C746
MIFRKVDAGVVLFLGLIMAGSAAAAGSPPPAPHTFGTSIQTTAEAVPPTLEQYLAQLAPRKTVDGCEHVTHENFCACYPDTCH